MNYLLGMEFTLLGTELIASYKKEGTKEKILLMPSKQEGNGGVSFGEAIEEIAQLVGENRADIQKQMEAKLKGFNDQIDLTALKLGVKTIYLDITKDGEAKSTDFALHLEIIADGVIPQDFKLINVSRLTIALWNTTKENILDKMALVEPTMN